jgi:hypothetical protein
MCSAVFRVPVHSVYNLAFQSLAFYDYVSLYNSWFISVFMYIRPCNKIPRKSYAAYSMIKFRSVYRNLQTVKREGEMGI